MNQPFDFSNLLSLQNFGDDSDADIINIISDEGEDGVFSPTPDELPILPVKNTVLYPGVVIPITVGRKKSIKLVRKAYKGDRVIGVLAQKTDAEDPTPNDLYTVGTVANILKMILLPDGSTTIIIQGKGKFLYKETVRELPYISAKTESIEETRIDTKKKENKALLASMREQAGKILKLNPDVPQEAQIALDNIESPSFLTYFLASNLNAEVHEKQHILELNDGVEKANKVLELMMKDVQLLELKAKIQNKVSHDLDQQQKEYFLRQQIKVLQDELGQENFDQDVEKLLAKGKNKKWNAKTAEHFEKEVRKLERINPAAAEFPLTMNYIEFLLELPWEEYTEDNFDLVRAKKIFDQEHYGLEKVKERIIEYLAVLKLKGNMKAPIICLFGPPGVGKTSLGKSIAKALKRESIRFSLGGLHDEAEIKGHRRTYIGAMAGKIIQNIKKAKSSNPVFILDEIDKIGRDFRGDPSSALLEVLDPEQNYEFMDHYLEIPYDLSKVLFIATANSLDSIQPALRDRMEIIEINGYTLEEKVEIAKRHLIPKQKENHGLKAKDITFHQKAVEKIISGYTRESGVRELDRQIGGVVRKIANKVAQNEEYEKTVKPEHITVYLGAERFENDAYQETEVAGVVTGLAWTQVGGEILFIETSLSKGKGKLTLSGQLGDVMKESAITALSYLKSRAEDMGINYKLFDSYDIHVHVPAGAVPKDGPSAGITMLTSLASAFTQREVKPKLAMTGEITLRGKVLPVGGIKEKILAAKRAGITTIILCKQNRKDIEEIHPDYLKGLEIIYVDNADEVISHALLNNQVKRKIKLEVEPDAQKQVVV